jgi:hypothetical protein
MNEMKKVRPPTSFCLTTKYINIAMSCVITHFTQMILHSDTKVSLHFFILYKIGLRDLTLTNLWMQFRNVKM